MSRRSSGKGSRAPVTCVSAGRIPANPVHGKAAHAMHPGASATLVGMPMCEFKQPYGHVFERWEGRPWSRKMPWQRRKHWGL